MSNNIKRETYSDLSIRLVKNKDNMTATAYRIISYYFSISNRFNDTFIEFWIGRKFIGGICGMEMHDGIFVDILLVNEKYLNQGYGTKLIDYLKNKYRRIEVESTPEAIDFYKKCGFSRRKDQSNKVYVNTILMHYDSK